MDVFGCLVIPNYLFWIAIILIGLYIYGTRNFSILSSLGYRGPKPKPFIGNFGLIMKKQLMSDFDMSLRKKYGDMVAIYDLTQPNIFVYDPEVIKHVLVKDFSAFCDRRKMNLRGKIFSKSLLDLTGTEWKRMRGLLTPFFTTSKLRNHMIGINTCIDRMLSRLDRVTRRGNEIEAKKMFGDFTLETICQTAFGYVVDTSEDEENPFVAAMTKVIQSTMRFIVTFLAALVPGLVSVLDFLGFSMFHPKSLNVLHTFVDTAIEERKLSNQEYPDFIQACLKAHEEQQLHHTGEDVSEGKGMTNTEILAHAMTFMFAGFDTTSTAMSFVMFRLADNPHWQERVLSEIRDVIGDQEVTYEHLKDLTTLEMCMDETFRLTPSLFRFDRLANREVTIKDYVIPKGCLVTVPIWALHHDPEFWTEPETFDPERFTPDKKKEILNSYIYHPFGTGPRNCIGMRLAMMEMKMAVVRLLQKYRWTVAERTKVPLEFVFGFFPTVKDGIWFNIEDRLSKTDEE